MLLLVVISGETFAISICKASQSDDGLTCICTGYNIPSKDSKFEINCDPYIKVLKFGNSNIMYFKAEVLRKFEFLETIHYDNVGLKYTDTSYALQKVKNVSFTNNIQQEFTYFDVPTLEVLHLEFNKIVIVTPFRHTPLLKELYLSSNRIYEISANTFENLKQLTVLKLDKNKLITISPRFLKYNFDLEELDLSFNKITRMEVNFYKSMSENFVLRMTGNPCYTNGNIDPLTEDIFVQNGDSLKLEHLLEYCFWPLQNDQKTSMEILNTFEVGGTCNSLV